MYARRKGRKQIKDKLTVKELFSFIDEYPVTQIFIKDILVYETNGYPIYYQHHKVKSYHLDIEFTPIAKTISPVLRITVEPQD